MHAFLYFLYATVFELQAKLHIIKNLHLKKSFYIFKNI